MSAPTEAAPSVAPAGFAFLVGALMKAASDREPGGIDRTTLQTLLEDALLHRSISSVGDPEGGVGGVKSALAEALVSFRQRGLVCLDDSGFHLTERGVEVIGRATQSPSNREFTELLERLVLEKHKDWFALG